MLSRKDIREFEKREKEQGDKFKAALRRRYNRSLKRQEWCRISPRGEVLPIRTLSVAHLDGLRWADDLEQVQIIRPSRFVRELRRIGLRVGQAPQLRPYNTTARLRLLQTLGGHLTKETGAKRPGWITREPLFWVTIVDEEQLYDPDAWEEVDEDDEHADPPKPLPKPEATELTAHFRRLMKGLNYVGMVEPTLYVSTQKIWERRYGVLYHLHALVWDIEKKQLREHCRRVRKEIRPVLPYATSAHYAQVREGDLLRMVWYMTKTPRKQYQLSKRATGSLKQWKRAINGVNSVLLHDQMAHMRLNQLLLAGGKGRKVLRRTRRDLEEWAGTVRRQHAQIAKMRRKLRQRGVRGIWADTAPVSLRELTGSAL
jgi:hypothetical protein